MKTGYKETLLRYLPQILTGIFTTLLLFSTLLIGRNWITNGDVIREQLNREMRFALQSKASEVEGILQRTYHTIRTISLLPGVREIAPNNRSSDKEDVVVTGRISQADFDTVQQLYNHVAASVAVSEIYLVLDGFDPNKGQVPFLMFDHVILDRFHQQLDEPPGSDPDHPEEYEEAEYQDYVRQLALLRQRPNPIGNDLNAITPIASGELLTCDNSQYLSLAERDPRNAMGFSLSVPIYGLNDGRFTGLVTAILRSNVMEAALLGWPLLPTHEEEWRQLRRLLGNSLDTTPVNYMLENVRTGIRIFDRRNTYWASAEQEREPTVFQATKAFREAGTEDWQLHSYVSHDELQSALADADQTALWQFLAVASVLSLAWLLIALALRTQLKAQRSMEKLANTDVLTGLPNRRFLMERLQHTIALSVRTKQAGALIFIDLDNFKTLNDTRGHEMGDMLLHEVARRLSATVRDVDTVARLGGDEFVVLVQHLNNDNTDLLQPVTVIVEKIQRCLNQPYVLEGHMHTCFSSMGIALFSGERQSASELMTHADLAMYQAKANGRNCFCFFASPMLLQAQERANLESELRSAVQRDEFVLYFQAQVDQTNCIRGAEALVRWQSPQRGLIGPQDFIALCEDSGLIIPLGNKILELACLQIAEWARVPTLQSLTVAVNISARQILHPDFVEQVLSALKQTKANPARLKLELTESLFVYDMTNIISKMSILSAAGILFSLDDFGTGYSSLSYLKKLPFHQLKIDRSFVADINDISDKHDGSSLVRTIITLGHALNLEVIAEGVETQQQREFLLKNGCQLYQGYLFSKPIPASAFVDLIKHRNDQATPPQETSPSCTVRG
ncbi:EAL domain-containing protein [uncultured Pseudomonas sp.]|uniref:putative bifunctional diguanylate cyclase/phosphodiesterase n=1 Tax=uncultured Pseudomonas sp. TaxID=114707 RepID=UPI00260FD267|nr:EAL domain-containing protein [uncultured Pseudomonas sp.]